MKRRLTIVSILILLMLSLIPQSVMAVENINSYKPFELTVSPIPIDGLHPSGSVLLTFKINNLPGDTGDSTFTWYVSIQKKIGNGTWSDVELIPSVRLLDENQTKPGLFAFEQIWVEDYEWDGASTISYRTYVSLEDLVGDGSAKTGYSNEVSIGLIASKWAVEELEEANGFGLIPSILQGADLTKTISREEFAELAVLLYEKTAETEAEVVAANPFIDTQNPQILKAYKLGITTGTSPNTFAPKVLINREQCATFLFRTIQAIAPNADYSILGVKDFPDQKFISGYAVDATKYMSKIGIIKGDAQGKFMPKATMTVGEASGYGMATRQEAILMTVRTFNKF